MVQGADVSSLERSNQGISVFATVGGETVQYCPKLLIDCGGFRTPVRPVLNSWFPGSFDMAQFTSPSGGLRFKVLWMKADGGDDGLPKGADFGRKEDAYVLNGDPKVPPSQFVKLGSLPGIARKPDGTLWRTFNLITLENHKIWSETSAEGMYQVLEKALPQVRDAYGR